MWVCLSALKVFTIQLLLLVCVCAAAGVSKKGCVLGACCLLFLTNLYGYPFLRLTVKYLAFAWMVGPNTLKRWMKADDAAIAASARKAAVVEVRSWRPKLFTANVIVNLSLTKQKMTAKYLFSVHMRRLKTKEDTFRTGVERSQKMFSDAMTEYSTIPPEDHLLWDAKAREYILAQPGILDQILKIMRKNPTSSWKHVSDSLSPKNWCSGETIRRLFDACGCSSYMERALPLMNAAQRKKSVVFGKHYRSNWGRKGKKGKYLIIHGDEKWFLGLRLAHAKRCEILGLEKSYAYMQHTSHNTKMMVICWTAYAFEDNQENGGKGFKVGMWPCWSARISQRQVNETVKDPVTGRCTFPSVENGGKSKRAKGDAYMVQANVTGSNDGTSKDPKFSSLRHLKESAFPAFDMLVAPGAPCEGYQVVIQWDHARPHDDKKLLRWVEAECLKRGWLWEPQSPQLPISNVQDLLVFPLMARRHAELCRQHAGFAPASVPVIWQMLQQVWKQLPVADVASAFVLAYRVLKMVVQHRGGNQFINDIGIHNNVRTDFRRTNTGIERFDGEHIAPPS